VLNPFVAQRSSICTWYFNGNCGNGQSDSANTEGAIEAPGTISIALVKVGADIYLAVVYSNRTSTNAGSVSVKVASNQSMTLVVQDDPNDNNKNNIGAFGGDFMKWSWQARRTDGFVMQTQFGARISLQHKDLVGLTSLRFVNGDKSNIIELGTKIGADDSISNKTLYVQVG
jgi:hypothetical protein